MYPPGREVVVAAANDFFVLRVDDPSHHYLLPIDWAYNNAPAHADGFYALEHRMDNWRKEDWLSDADVATCETLYSGPAQLTLLVDSAHEQWMRDRLITNPAFRVQRVGSSTEWSGLTIWSVHRIGDPGPAKMRKRMQQLVACK